ncbi:mono-functional DNA-alkylating methyl methanesulfonate N-term-domain-containing protein [Astrocystis sublimbata]|nr:mono-functional DNA-alkylating methyl methanesulfonate N-term-domain-containing protein [Astrocystis sublimbata]
MASLQTHVLVDDRWVTQNVTPEELLQPRVIPTVTPAPKPPSYGVLTKTVIESPIVRWALPVQLRSSQFNDVALVGGRCVQICELDVDLQLQPIAKIDFSSDIRNCRVLGTHEYLRRKKEDTHASYYSDNGKNAGRNTSAPPAFAKGPDIFQQVLVLVLSAGDLVFLVMNLTAAGNWKFVPSYVPIFGDFNEDGEYIKDGQNSGQFVDPGFHMAISPDGGYLSLACSENLMIVYKLRSIGELHTQLTKGQSLKPILSMKARAMKGVIHILEFLYTGSSLDFDTGLDSFHENLGDVALILITAQSGVLRLVVYDWDAQHSFQDELCKGKPGHRLDTDIGIPMFVIPLTIAGQFLVVTEKSLAVYSDFFGGPPTRQVIPLGHRDKTEWHHGTNHPLWGGWTRPSREESYHAGSDFLYLAREDGWISSLEIDRGEDIKSIYLGPMDCNINAGFASLGTSHGDVLIATSVDGPGAIWHVNPRETPKRVGSLPSWSPTVDLVLATDRKQLSRQSASKKAHDHMLEPDRMFASSGRDTHGAIVEVRYGIQAKIGLDLQYPSRIKECWVIPSFDSTPEAGFQILLALPESSALLHISHDLTEVSEQAQESVDFDLLSTTLACHISPDLMIQITTERATIRTSSSCYQHLMIDIVQNTLATITDAAVTSETLALTVESKSSSKVMIFVLNNNEFALKHTVEETNGEITALAIDTLSIGVCVLAGISYRGSSALTLLPLDVLHDREQTVPGAQKVTLDLQGDPNSTTHAIISIVGLGNGRILVGKSDGDVLLVQFTNDGNTERGLKVLETHHFGVSSSYVFPGIVFDVGPSALVCNDAGLAIVKVANATQPTANHVESISRIWLTDANEPDTPSPVVNSVARLRDIPGYGESTWAMISGSHLLITELQPRTAPVPRYLPTGGTPVKILYSKRLDALVAVVKKQGVPSLHFYDRATGADLSRPVNEQHADINYIRPLGDPNIKVVSLLSWHFKTEYQDKDGKPIVWFVILSRLGDSQGRLIMVSAEEEEVATDTGTARQIRFCAKHERKIKDGLPRLGATDDDGLFISFEKTIEYHVIEDKKFRTAMKYDLPSPAMHVEVVDGRLHVLTSGHSLLILDYKSETALKSERMIGLHTDEQARYGLHSIDVGSAIDIKAPQKLVLVSDLMCGVYGLWCLGPQSKAKNLKLIFRADLKASIRKFVSGYTRPRWARSGDRQMCFGYKPLALDEREILGLAIDGSLTSFAILDEDTWRLLRYVQNLTVLAEVGDGNAGIAEENEALVAAQTFPLHKMHVDGDVLKKCLDGKILERVVATEGDVERLEMLLKPLGLDGVDDGQGNGYGVLDAMGLVHAQTYAVLGYYLGPAL